MDDLKRATVMERVLRDMRGEGNSVATMSKRYNLSEESIRTILGIKTEEPEPELRGPGRFNCTNSLQNLFQRME